MLSKKSREPGHDTPSDLRKCSYTPSCKNLIAANDKFKRCASCRQKVSRNKAVNRAVDKGIVPELKDDATKRLFELVKRKKSAPASDSADDAWREVRCFPNLNVYVVTLRSRSRRARRPRSVGVCRVARRR